jgi:hypothetical protein
VTIDAIPGKELIGKVDSFAGIGRAVRAAAGR